MVMVARRVVMVAREWSGSSQDSNDRLIVKRYQEGKRSI